MRLDKEDFTTLLAEPIISYVSPDEAENIVNQDGQWLDVGRKPAGNMLTLAEIVRIPLQLLRLKVDTLDSDATYVVTSNTLSHSCAAAHILTQCGLNAFVLKA